MASPWLGMEMKPLALNHLVTKVVRLSLTREALKFAERCAQRTNELDEDEGLKPGLLVGSEDCLALYIYAPAGAENEALPVPFEVEARKAE